MILKGGEAAFLPDLRGRGILPHFDEFLTVHLIFCKRVGTHILERQSHLSLISSCAATSISSLSVIVYKAKE